MTIFQHKQEPRHIKSNKAYQDLQIFYRIKTWKINLNTPEKEERLDKLRQNKNCKKEELKQNLKLLMRNKHIKGLMTWGPQKIQLLNS